MKYRSHEDKVEAILEKRSIQQPSSIFLPIDRPDQVMHYGRKST